MARTELERSVQPSLLDRLTDLEPERLTDGPTSRDVSERAFRRSVQRDVEWLLNSRRGMVLASAAQPETHQSVLEYGLKDMSGITVGSDDGRKLLRDYIRDTLERFEPRLTDIVVVLGETDKMNRLQVRFSIQATLRMDPSPEQIVFDTVLEVSSGSYEVSASE